MFKSFKDPVFFCNKIFKVLVFIFYINSVFVLIGVAFNIEFFKSYSHSLRFGSVGLLNAHTFAMYFYFFIIIYFYNQYVKYKKCLPSLIYTIIIALLLGKKAVMLFVSLLAIYHAYFFVKVNVKTLSISVLSILSVIFIFKEQLLIFTFKLFPFWAKIYEDKGLLYTITSSRSEKFEFVVNQILNNWSVTNYFIGGAVLPDYRVEYGVVDLFIFFGVLGLFIYFLLFKEIFKNIDIKDRVLLLLILFVSFLVGGFLVNINLMMFYICLIALFYNKEELDYSEETCC